MAAPSLHFLVLHHGYHGTTEDFAYMSSLLKEGMSEPAKYIVLEPKVNEGFKTDQGVLRCSERLQEYLLTAIDAAVHASSRQPAAATTALSATTNADSSNAASKPEDRGPAAISSTSAPLQQPQASEPPPPPSSSLVEVHMNFITHSMGGLIVRATLPDLSAALSVKYGRVHWDSFCTIATPHTGVRQMPSLLRKRVGDWTGCLLGSTGLKDMYLHTNVVSEVLLEEPYLRAWRAFQRRVLVGVVNDNTVMTYSSLFMVPPEDVALLETRKDAVGPASPPRSGSDSSSGKGPEDADARALPPATHLKEGLVAQYTEQHTTSRAAAVETTDEASAVSRPYHPDASLPSSLWPRHVMPTERAMAARIVAAVAPFDVYLVDFRPLIDPSRAGAGTSGEPAESTPRDTAVPVPAVAVRTLAGKQGADGHYGAFVMPHRAIICKSPCHQPQLFGFVSEFIAETLFGVVPARTAAEEEDTGAHARETVEPKVAAMMAKNE